jgi:hypothetical protein
MEYIMNKRNMVKVRTTYLRDPRTIMPREKSKNNPNGEGFTRGAPLACLMSYIDRKNNAICYNFAVCASGNQERKGDAFNKKLAAKIVSGRLDIAPFIVQGDIPNTGHEITKLIMADIYAHSEEELEAKIKLDKEIGRRLAAGETVDMPIKNDNKIPQTMRSLVKLWIKKASLPRLIKSVSRSMTVSMD